MSKRFKGWRDYKGPALLPEETKPKESKYKNKKVELWGIGFDSKKEASRYMQLKLMADTGMITDLKLQVEFEIIINDQKVCSYIADFTYMENEKLVVEDAKGFKTREYRLKKKLMKAVHKIEIKEA